MDQLPAPLRVAKGVSQIEGWVRLYLTQLEAMFGDEGLARLRQRSPHHPAVELFDQLHGVEASGGAARWPDEYETVAALGAVGLDLSTWAPDPPYEDFWSLLDDDTRRWTIRSLAQPEQFEDVMAELFTWGWLRSQGFDARRVNELGTSDVVLDDATDPWRCEVKRIHIGTAQARIAQVVKKANQQIKTSDPASAGTLFVSLGRASTRAALDDRIPNDVGPYIAAVREALKTHCRSVAQVVVMWDDVMIVGEPPAPVLYAFRRRSEVVMHPMPRRVPKYASDKLSVGRSATVLVRWTASNPEVESAQSLRPLAAGDLEVSQLFRQENEVPDGIRARHAIEAFLEPDAATTFDLSGMTVWLVTRRVAGPPAYTLLLLASRPEGENKITIAAGFRLFRDCNGTELWRDPQTAFQELIERYGMTVRVGEISGLFIPAAVVGPGEGVLGDSSGDSFFVSAFMRLFEDGRVEYAWVFAIDTRRYRSAARARSS